MQDREIARVAKQILDDEEFKGGLNLCDVLWIISIGVGLGKDQWR